MDQNTFTKLAKDLVNNHMEEAEEEGLLEEEEKDLNSFEDNLPL